MPWKAGFTPASPGTNTLRVFCSALAISSAEMSRKMAISMMPSTTPVARRQADAAVVEPPHDQSAQDREHDPGKLEFDAEVARQEDRAIEAEAAEQERHDERLGDREAPRHHPAANEPSPRPT